MPQSAFNTLVGGTRQDAVKAAIKQSFHPTLMLAATHGVGPEQLRILLDELLVNYVDYEHCETREAPKRDTDGATERR